MSSVFYDSFDHYNQLLQKWSSGESGYNTNPTFVRTGSQSLNPTNSTVFAQVPRINFTSRQTMIAGYAYYTTSFGIQGAQMSYWYNTASGAQFGQLDANTNGSISVFFFNSLAWTTVPGVLNTGAYYYIEIKCGFFQGGPFVLKVNGQVVLSETVGTLAGFAGVDGFLLPGNTTFDTYYDDLYLLDDTGTTNNDFLGAVQIFAILPDANETPLQWTPLAGTNFSEVNQVPPPGDAAYVSSNTPGQIDQYHYTITGPSGSYAIKAIQHSLSCRLDAAGSHTISSQINTHTSGNPQVGTNAVTGNYEFAIFPWDVNPNTGVAFQPTDFSTTFVGPNLTT